MNNTLLLTWISIFLFMIVLACYSACSSKIDSETLMAELMAMNNSDVLELSFYSNETNPTIKALFDEANRIVKKTEHPKGKFSDISKHYGSWFIMNYPELIRDPIIEDGNNYLSQVYLVDMLGKRVISRNDWQSVLPLYQCMLARLPTDPLKRKDHLSLMAYITSIIAFGHTHYKEIGYEIDPKNPNNATLWYYLYPSEWENIRLQCVLKITKDNITFEIIEHEYNPYKKEDSLNHG